MSRALASSLALVAPLAALLLAPAARAQSFTLTFEDAANVPAAGTPAAPSKQDAATSLAAAYGGSDGDATATVHGVTFDNLNPGPGGGFTVFRDTYTNGVLGSDPYGPTDGAIALTNVVNPPGLFATAPDTGPGDAGPEGLEFATTDVLTGVLAATVDYGDGSPGASMLTITPLGASGDLGPGIGAPLSSAFFAVDTSSFLAYAGHITGYRVDRDAGTSGYAALGGGGNYVLDDLTFTTAPEPSAFAGFALGALGLAGLGLKARKRA